MGYKHSKLVGKTNDKGVDIRVFSEGWEWQELVIQCKGHYGTPALIREAVSKTNWKSAIWLLSAQVGFQIILLS